MSITQPASVRDFCAGERALGIVAAFPWEVQPLLRRSSAQLFPVADSGAPYANLHALRLGVRPALLVVAGVGAENARRSAEYLAASTPLCGFVSIGFAGGLDASLQVGDIVLADRVVDRDSKEQFSCDWNFLSAPCTLRGTLLSAASVVANSEEKRLLAGEFQAVAVDMEAAGVARAALRAGLPLGAVKAVTDSAEHSLSIDFDRCRSEDKRFSVWATVRQGLRSYRGARDLWRLAWNARRAAGALAAALGPV